MRRWVDLLAFACVCFTILTIGGCLATTNRDLCYVWDDQKLGTNKQIYLYGGDLGYQRAEGLRSVIANPTPGLMTNIQAREVTLSRSDFWFTYIQTSRAESSAEPGVSYGLRHTIVINLTRTAAVSSIYICIWSLLNLNRFTIWLAARYRRKHGCCAACGYDLRSSPDGSTAPFPQCPECGALAKKY